MYTQAAHKRVGIKEPLRAIESSPESVEYGEQCLIESPCTVKWKTFSANNFGNAHLYYDVGSML
jgi:hypothetical protein